jgi:hypothetical protein
MSWNNDGVNCSDEEEYDLRGDRPERLRLIDTYSDLPAAVQNSIPGTEFVSPEFQAEATRNNLNLYQWAFVVHFIRAASGDTNSEDVDSFRPFSEAGLVCDNTLDLSNCEGDLAMPDILVVLGSFDLSNNQGQIQLPNKSLMISGNFDISRCLNIELPENLIVGSVLNPFNCNKSVVRQATHLLKNGHIYGGVGQL